MSVVDRATVLAEELVAQRWREELATRIGGAVVLLGELGERLCAEGLDELEVRALEHHRKRLEDDLLSDLAELMHRIEHYGE
jgi:hypothetical protein